MNGGSITVTLVNVLPISAMVPFASVSPTKPVDWTALLSSVLLAERAAQWLAVWQKMHFGVTPVMENVLGWAAKRSTMIQFPAQHSCGHSSVELPMCIFL